MAEAATADKKKGPGLVNAQTAKTMGLLAIVTSSVLSAVGGYLAIKEDPDATDDKKSINPLAAMGAHMAMISAPLALFALLKTNSKYAAVAVSSAISAIGGYFGYREFVKYAENDLEPRLGVEIDEENMRVKDCDKRLKDLSFLGLLGEVMDEFLDTMRGIPSGDELRGTEDKALIGKAAVNQTMSRWEKVTDTMGYLLGRGSKCEDGKCEVPPQQSAR